MPSPVCLNNLQLINQLTCYLELIGKIIAELNLRQGQTSPGLAVNQLTEKLFQLLSCDSSIILDKLPDFSVPPDLECECEPDSLPIPDTDGCGPDPEPEPPISEPEPPVPENECLTDFDDIFVYGIYLLRENYSRYRLFDKQVYAVDQRGCRRSLTKLISPATRLITNPLNALDVISDLQAFCCLRRHFDQIINYLKCCQCGSSRD